LNNMHSIALQLTNAHFIIKFLIIVTLLSLVNYFNITYINPFLTKLLNIGKINDSKNSNNILLEVANDLIINFTSIFLLLFLFFMVPLTIYYVFAILKALSENLSIQMNIISILMLFLTIKSLTLFVDYMQSQFGAAAIAKVTVGRTTDEDKASAVLSSGMTKEQGNKFTSFLTSYILFFIVPIVVALAKIQKLIVSLLSNMNPMKLTTEYKLIFISIILFSFYYTIEKDLDAYSDFPYSIIYAILSIMAVVFIAYKNKTELLNKT